MPSQFDHLSIDAKRHLIRQTAFLTAQVIADQAQLFAATLRDGPADMAAPDALMAFAVEVRVVAARDADPLFPLTSEESKQVGTLS